MLNLIPWLELLQPRELQAGGRVQNTTLPARQWMPQRVSEQLCQLENLLQKVSGLPSPAAEGPAARGGLTLWHHRPGEHSWAGAQDTLPRVTPGALTSDNVAGGGTVPSSCSPRWDRAPRPEVSVDAAAAQKPELWKEFECYIYTLTNKSTACHRYTVLLKLLIFIS